MGVAHLVLAVLFGAFPGLVNSPLYGFATAGPVWCLMAVGSLLLGAALVCNGRRREFWTTYAARIGLGVVGFVHVLFATSILVEGAPTDQRTAWSGAILWALPALDTIRIFVNQNLYERAG